MNEISESARELLADATRADGSPPVSDQALLAVAQGKRTLVEFDGAAIGIIGQGEIDLVVRPESRGRGVASRALRELLGNDARLDSPELRAWAHGDNPAATALLRGAGFTPTRTLLRMSLDPQLLPEAAAAARPLPTGFVVRPFGSSPGNAPLSGAEAEADAWVRVNAAAFAEHPEQGAMTREDFDALTREKWFDREDLRLAFMSTAEPVHPADLAAFAWVKTTRDAGLTETELYALGVSPVHIGRGLGAAMLGESLRRMASHSPDRITLYVEGDNAAALPLYERAGFVVSQRSTQWLVNTR